MYTGTADHSLTAELVDRVSVPVIASGDIADRETAERVLDTTGAAAVMVGRGAQGRPWALREMAGDGPAEANPAEVVAELVRFMREVEREMGDRAVGFLRKFYGWYLRGTPNAKQVRAALMACPTVADAERELLAFCPEAEARVAAHEAELDLLGDIEADRLLDLPISVYGGG
jgi:tRNA-dihydrouridine synthase B